MKAERGFTRTRLSFHDHHTVESERWFSGEKPLSAFVDTVCMIYSLLLGRVDRGGQDGRAVGPLHLVWPSERKKVGSMPTNSLALTRYCGAPRARAPSPCWWW